MSDLRSPAGSHNTGTTQHQCPTCGRICRCSHPESCRHCPDEPDGDGFGYEETAEEEIAPLPSNGEGGLDCRSPKLPGTTPKAEANQAHCDVKLLREECKRLRNVHEVLANHIEAAHAEAEEPLPTALMEAIEAVFPPGCDVPDPAERRRS